MIVTTEYMSEHFKVFNKAYFENSLPTPKFEVTREKSRLGHCAAHYQYYTKTREYVIGITKAFNFSEYTIKSILLHEMIHLYMYVKYPKTNIGHGLKFQEKAKIISMMSGITIDVLKDVKDEKMSKTKELSIILFNHNNMKQIIKVQKGYETTFIQALKRHKIEGYKHFTIRTNSPILNTLKTCRTIIHSYKVSEDIATELKNCNVQY